MNPSGQLRVGTSSWSSTDWYDVFYPKGLAPAEFIGFYARHFDTVEIDATFYRPPTRTNVSAWAKRTPEGFIFSAKVPQVITHEKYLEDCQEEMNDFIGTMEGLNDKLGPMVLQFPYVAKSKDPDEYRSGDDFCRRLAAFLPLLPADHRYAVEVRNAHWLKPRLLDLLRAHRTALVLACYYTLPSLDELMATTEVLTAGFSYVRFLGDRRKIEALVNGKIKSGEKERHWDELVIDRRGEIARWIGAIRELMKHRIDMYIYFNNHYAGHAPGSVSLFRELWEKG
ncbi:MAG: DUF72 domain-containing protein [Acidobacteria bacterium]|nr:DUF72 domain-containing protein [Acidobacteriota bacterium]